MDQHTLLLAAVPVIGFVAGFINTLAGSGSLLTLPLLILLGLPANVANGTNRVGVLLQNIVAVATFRRRGALPLAGSWKLIVPSVVGGIIGAELAVDLDEQLLRQTIGVLMLVLLAVMLLKPGAVDRRARRAARAAPARRGAAVLRDRRLRRLHSSQRRVVPARRPRARRRLQPGRRERDEESLVLVFTAAALVVFVVNDQVEWTLGLLLGAGQAAGAWVAAHFAVKRGAEFVRWVVVVITVGSAVALFAGVGL